MLMLASEQASGMFHLNHCNLLCHVTEGLFNLNALDTVRYQSNGCSSNARIHLRLYFI